MKLIHLSKLNALIIVASLLATVLLVGCSGSGEEVTIRTIEDNTVDTANNDGTEENAENPSSQNNPETEGDFTKWESEPAQLVWATYWDTDGLKEALEEKTDSYDSIGYFAAYYDPSCMAFVPEGTVELVDELKASGLFSEKKAFLTFVNDQTTPEGSKLKDTELLYTLIGSPELIEKHVDDVVKLAKDYGFNGIEIDYEAIKGDMTLWNCFLDFIKLLTERACDEGLYLRVLFEPNAPIDSFSWPEGPEYVMMCYNLYGFSAEMGPKANPGFLNEMVDKMEVLGDNINFALANGGFDWAADGSSSQVQNNKCSELIATYGVTPVRDEQSHALYFTYPADDGEHTVWYADEETIEAWKNVIKGRGHEQFSLWRLP